MGKLAIKAIGRRDSVTETDSAIRNGRPGATSKTADNDFEGGQEAQVIQRTILVVEDNPAIQAIARAFLEMAGYSVVTASDGQEGFRIYQQLRSGIGLLLTDVTMPKMDGLELAGCVLELDSHLPVLFMSGDVLWSDGSYECISKPFAPSELVCLVSRVLEASEKRSCAMAPA